MNIGDPNQYNPGQVTAPSAAPGMSPQMMQRLAMIRQLRAQRGMAGGMPQRQPTGGYQDMLNNLNRGPQTAAPGMQDQLSQQNTWRDPQAAAGYVNQLSQSQNVPVAGAMGQSNPGYAPPNMPQMSGTAQPQIGQFSRGAQPVNPVGPVTTQGQPQRGLPTLPNGLAQRMGIFR